MKVAGGEPMPCTGSNIQLKIEEGELRADTFPGMLGVGVQRLPDEPLEGGLGWASLATDLSTLLSSSVFSA